MKIVYQSPELEDTRRMDKVNGVRLEYVSSCRLLIHCRCLVELRCDALFSVIAEVEAKDWKHEGNECKRDYKAAFVINGSLWRLLWIMGNTSVYIFK